MRDGLEIDSAEQVDTIPYGTTVHALERRLNSSNITRFKVVFEGITGWISERVRGEDEEMMVQYLRLAPAAAAQAQVKLQADAAAAGYDGPTVFDDVGSLAEATAHWDALVAATGEKPYQVPRQDLSFQRYLELASTIDGRNAWSVEADMQLSEVISRCAQRDGVTPNNLSQVSVQRAVAAITSQTSPLRGVCPSRAVARSALMRVANRIVSHALPTLSVSVPEEGLRSLGLGCDDSVDLVPADLSAPDGASSALSVGAGAGSGAAPAVHTVALGSGGAGSSGTGVGSSSSSPAGSPGSHRSRRSNGSGYQFVPDPRRLTSQHREQQAAALQHTAWSPQQVQLQVHASTLPWVPACGARRLRRLRRLLFTHTKLGLWERILDATETATTLQVCVYVYSYVSLSLSKSLSLTPLPSYTHKHYHQHDEYEDPREIATLRVNRVKATASRLAALPDALQRLKQSVFGQLHKETRGWVPSAFRRSYVGKGHGGQKRAFKVQFLGEGVNDYGGPYRALFDQAIDELQCDSLLVGHTPSERCLLPLLVPCPNRSSGVGDNQEKYQLNTAPSSPLAQELCLFFGKMVGMAVRHNLTLALDFSALLWRALVRSPLAQAHLQAVDSFGAKHLQAVTATGLQEEALHHDTNYVPAAWAELDFTAHLPDGGKAELVPGGTGLQVTLGNWREYVSLLERARLSESQALYKAFRSGLAAVLPVALLPLFTSTELEELVSGSSTVDIALLRQCTEYEGIDPESDQAALFWAVLESFDNEQVRIYIYHFSLSLCVCDLY